MRLGQRIRMWLRGGPVGTLQRLMPLVREAELPYTADELEAHHWAGGNIVAVVEAALVAKRLDLPADLRTLLEADLAGEDLDLFVARGMVFELRSRVDKLKSEMAASASARRELEQMLGAQLDGLNRTKRWLSTASSLGVQTRRDLEAIVESSIGDAQQQLMQVVHASKKYSAEGKPSGGVPEYRLSD